MAAAPRPGRRKDKNMVISAAMTGKRRHVIWALVLSLPLIMAGGPALSEKRLDERELYNQLTLFGDVLEQVRRNYVDAPSDKERIEAALSGMMASLDPIRPICRRKTLRICRSKPKANLAGWALR